MRCTNHAVVERPEVLEAGVDSPLSTSFAPAAQFLKLITTTMKSMPHPIPVLILALAATLLAPIPKARASDSLVAFGLTNKAIFGAGLEVGDEFNGMSVLGLSDLGHRGVSVKLGEADAGMTFAPYKFGPLYDDQFMVAHAYGRVGGIQRRVSTVSCRRDGYSWFPLTVDLLPLGSLLQTIEVYSGATLVARQRHTLGNITIDTSSRGFSNPRVNPFCRWPDGGVGVLLESGDYYLQAVLPDGRQVNGNRVFFRAEFPLFDVDYLTRVDIFGGGPSMDEFVALDERIGVFGRLHRGLGDVVLTAKGGRLKLAGLASATSDGVQVEVGDTPSFDARLLPVSIAAEGATMSLSALGTSPYNYGVWAYPYGSPFLGPVDLQRSTGSNTFSIDFRSVVGQGARVAVYSAGAWQGTAQETSTNTLIAGFGTNLMNMVSFGVRSGDSNSAASLVFKLAESHSIHFGGLTLTGDEFHFSPITPEEDIGTFATVQMLGASIGPVTIVREDVSPTPPFRFAIEKRGADMVLSWPTTSPTLYLQSKLQIHDDWNYFFPQRTTVNRSRHELLVPNQAGSEFFKLHDYLVSDPVE
jgi:hypothetical protein